MIGLFIAELIWAFSGLYIYHALFEISYKHTDIDSSTIAVFSCVLTIYIMMYSDPLNTWV